MEELCPLRGGGERGDLAGLGGFGRSPFSSAQENMSSSPPSFFFFFSLSPPLCNSLPSPNATLSSLLLHNQPKVLLLDSRWSDSEVPSPRAPSPLPWPWARGLGSSLLAGALHDLGDKVDDGGGRLVGVELGKEVAGVVCGAALLPGHEAKEPAGAGEGDRKSVV